MTPAEPSTATEAVFGAPLSACLELPQSEGRDVQKTLLKYLLEHVREAVMFIGGNGRILGWNGAAEQMFGVRKGETRTLKQLFDAVSLTPRQPHEGAATDLTQRDAVANQRTVLMLGTISTPPRPPTAVDIHVVPMQLPSGEDLGSLILAHDATYKVNLQQQVQELREKTISDPLTEVANRVEFERVLATCCQHSKTSDVAFSLIVCDIDFFKRINDEQGHQVGDQALVSFATLLNRSIRHADFLARYGGEEFVIICNGSDAREAVDCAEKIRKRLERAPLGNLGQYILTASFGVAQFHPGDTPKTLFARADQALLAAKEAGRNRVVLGEFEADHSIRFVNATDGLASDQPGDSSAVLSAEFTSPNPVEVLAPKLEGFLNDHNGRVVKIEPSRLLLQTGEMSGSLFRRSSDRRVPFQIEIQLVPIKLDSAKASKQIPATGLRISLAPLRSRDRRLGSLQRQAEAMLWSLRRYLMLLDDQSDEPGAAP